MLDFLNTWLTNGGFWVAIPLIIVGCAALIKGADFLVDGASALAKKYGVSDIVIGLRLHAFTPGGPGSIPGCGTKILKAAGSGKK